MGNRKGLRRNPNFRMQERKEMIQRLEAEVKAREVNELADKIGIGTTKRRTRKKKVVAE